jgi:signal transduction histidine kinase
LDNVINNVQEDEFGYLWLSGLRGIYRISRQQLNDVASGNRAEVECAVYGEADGMLNSECNGGDNQPSGCKDRFGRIWFPTTQGVVMIDPKKIKRNEVPPPVVIEQVMAGDKIVFGDITHDSNVQDLTSHGQNRKELKTMGQGRERLETSSSRHPAVRIPPGGARVLEIHYTANILTAPERVRFRYQLEGYDKKWRLDENNRRVAFYTGLRPRAYVFHVEACNNHGFWNETGATFAFCIAPHFWETWLFYAASGLSLSFVILGLHHRRMAGLRRVQRLEQQRALHEERARIAKDLHDDLGANLTGLALQLDVVHSQAQPNEVLKKSLENIARSTRIMVDNMREVVWAMNSQCDDTESLTSFLGQYAENYLGAAGLRCRLEFPSQLPAQPISSHARHQLFLVVKEALHNTVRHARASEVRLRIEQNTDSLVLNISDDGCGLPPESTRPREHGLDNMRKRLRDLGGEFSIVGRPAQGTCITLKITLLSQTSSTNSSGLNSIIH